MLYLACGSRLFRDPLIAHATIIERICQLPSGGHLIHGNAPGADTASGEVATKCGLKVTAYPADWRTHEEDCRCKGRDWCREAGKRRNLLMLDQNPALVIAFWNGHSTGTLHTITEAKRREIPTEVIRLR